MTTTTRDSVPDPYWDLSEDERIIRMQRTLVSEEPVTTGTFTQPDVEKRYLQYLADRHGDITDIPRLCEVMWNAGGRSAIAAMTEMSDVIPLLGQISTRVLKLRALMKAMEGE